MRALILSALAAALCFACASSNEKTAYADMSDPRVPVNASAPARNAEEWSFNATIIEACSCPMFCQCYFNSEPASHPGCCPPGTDPKDAPRYCRFNNAFRVNRGHFGSTQLEGVKFWVAGDLGSDFSKNEMDWAVLHFDPSVTKEQREAISTIVDHLYPVRWQSLTVGADYPIEWAATRDRAVARLGEDAAEVVLKKNEGMTEEPIVIENLRYWGAPRNDGFIMMQNEVQAYRATGKPYEFEGTNGFMITVDLNSTDAKKAPANGY
jgi:hypothetical protein